MTQHTPRPKRPFVWKKPQSIRIALERFLRRCGKPEIVMLNNLWQHWEMVMGPDIAALACPLGSKANPGVKASQREGVNSPLEKAQHTLLLGGEDTMTLQDISYMQQEILERANAFMGQEFFSSIKVHLTLDKNPLNQEIQPKEFIPVQLPTVPLSGKYLKDMSMDSPVARCYALFAQRNT